MQQSPAPVIPTVDSTPLIPRREYLPTPQTMAAPVQPTTIYPQPAGANEWGVLPTFGLMLAAGYAGLRYALPAMVQGLQRASASSSKAEALQGDLLRSLIEESSRTQREFMTALLDDSKTERATERDATENVLRRAVEIQEQATKLQDGVRSSLASLENIFSQMDARESRREHGMNGLQNSMTALQLDFARFLEQSRDADAQR